MIAYELRRVSHFKRVIKKHKQNNKNKKYGIKTAKPKDTQYLAFSRKLFAPSLDICSRASGNPMGEKKRILKDKRKTVVGKTVLEGMGDSKHS